MKNIDARAALRLAFAFFWFIALAIPRHTYAGDYYIYQDTNGTLVLSNNVPPAGSKIIKQETLSEVTDQQLMESRLRENSVALDNRVATLEKTIGELTENLRAQSQAIDYFERGQGDTNIAVGVTQAPGIVAQPAHRNFRRLPNPKNNLPHVQPRPTGSAVPCCGGARRAG